MRFVTRLQVFFYISQILCSQIQTQPRTLYSGILLDKTWDIGNMSVLARGDVQPVISSTNGTGFRDFVDNCCQMFASRNIIALAGPGDGFIGGIGAQLAERFSIPFIGCTSASFPLGPNHISLYPPVSTQADAVLGLAVELGSPCIVVFTSGYKDHQTIPVLKVKAKSLVLSFKVFEILNGKSPEPSAILQISKEILVMNKSGSCVVVLDCVPTMVNLIFEASVSLGIPTTRFMWVMLDEEYIRSDRVASEIPLNVIGIKMAFTWRELLQDAMSLVNRTFDPKQFTHVGSSGVSCLLPGRPWIDGGHLYKRMIQEKFTGLTGPISFNKDGERTQTLYELVRMTQNTDGKRFWDKVGTAISTNIKLQSNFWKKGFKNSSTSNVIRMVTVAEDPLIILSKDRVKSNEECVLSHVCVSYKRVKIQRTNRTRTEVIRNCCIGYVIDVLNLLQGDLGFTTELYFVEDGLYGAYDPTTNTWNGMINDLIQGKAEVALTTLTINEVRSRVVEYSNALLYGETKLMLYNEQPKMDTIEFGFLAPFNLYLWIALLVTINVIIVVVWLFDHFSPYGHYQSNFGRLKFSFNVPACMSYVWSAVYKLQLDNVTPSSGSARTVSAVFSFGTLILVSTYTANLAASLVSTKESLAVKSIRDSKFTDPSSGFKFATLKSSSTEMIFSRSSDPVFKKIYENMRPHQVHSYSEAVKKLRSGQLNVFIDDSPFLDLTASKQPDCSLRIVGRPISMHGYGLAFRKGSRWTAPMSQLLLKYDRRDYFRKLTKKWFAGICDNSKATATKAFSMEFKHFSGLFLVCLSSALICSSLLAAELLLHRFGRKRLVTYTFEKSNTSVRDLTLGSSLSGLAAAELARHRNLPTGESNSACSYQPSELKYVENRPPT